MNGFLALCQEALLTDVGFGDGTAHDGTAVGGALRAKRYGRRHTYEIKKQEDSTKPEAGQSR